MRIKLGRPLLMKSVISACDGERLLGATASNLQAITHITTDSREVERGDLYIALHGLKDDGHRYIPEAICSGVSAIVCERIPETQQQMPCTILVKNTLNALLALARTFASEIPHKTITVTGSVGKTTTRRYLASVLGQNHRVHESPENYNNPLGTALTLLSMPPDTNLLIAECGMDGAGQIAFLSELLKPDYAIITNIGMSHIEKLGTMRAICMAKLEIMKGLKQSHHLYIEGNDAYLSLYAPKDAVTVSASYAASVHHASNIRFDSHGTTFDYCSPTETIKELHIPSLGAHTLSCAMFAVALSRDREFGIGEEELRHALLTYVPEYQRQTIVPCGRFTLLLDTYNACPASMYAAMETANLISQESGGGKIAILGDMLELGSYTETSHFEVGAEIGKRSFKALFAIGKNAQTYKHGALAGGMPCSSVFTFQTLPSKDELLSSLLPFLEGQDVLLLKGSHATGLNHLTPILKTALNENYM